MAIQKQSQQQQSQQQQDLEATQPTSASAVKTSYKIQLFDAKHYNNVEHQWDNKPFVVDKMRSFFGAVREERMDKVIKAKRSKIDKQGLWDPEGLVLTDVSKPFKSKLLFSINQDYFNESKMDLELPEDLQIQFMSGIWLSKVYVGEYGQFLNWVDDAIAFVKDRYNRNVDAHHDWFVYYPSALEMQKPEGQSVVTFFIKVSD